jgi:hypothetical protein
MDEDRRVDINRRDILLLESSLELKNVREMIFVVDCGCDSLESLDCWDKRFVVGCIDIVSFADGEQTRRKCNLIDV